MKNNEALDTVKEIRALMEQSSKFLTFSGISVILIGIYALAGACFARNMLQNAINIGEYDLGGGFLVSRLILIGGAVLLASAATVLTLSFQKSLKHNQPFFNRLALRTLLNFSLPLTCGGIFCLAMIFQGYYGVVSSVMLLFYGLSLINVSKYTYGSIFWLGLCELALGLACAFFPGKGLLFWTLGFGILHIVYGIYFYFGIERKAKRP